ncbi:guanine nucleotide-binding protein G(s) subunit alpha-like [Meleagris gallopavo]|uniref:guanine nucleotide-binding protein G(s) subunit alpha-like n=1 Tax=Meleagris gallopavo TaxID=9103 RepID=UPI0012AB705B|nr:guanine nucleotide-binding protein G(s) subunit alpha-like [Meleagris gallopavo]
MGCLGNSKTEDQRIDEKAQREANKKIEKQLQKERLAYKATHRLLLLGKAAGQGRAGILGNLYVCTEASQYADNSFSTRSYGTRDPQ